jgi:hypothetical protein
LISDLIDQRVNDLFRSAWPSLARGIGDPQLGWEFIPRLKARHPVIDGLARYSQVVGDFINAIPVGEPDQSLGAF